RLAVGVPRRQRGRPADRRRVRARPGPTGERYGVARGRFTAGDGALIPWVTTRPAVRSGLAAGLGTSIVQEKPSASTRVDRQIAGSKWSRRYASRPRRRVAHARGMTTGIPDRPRGSSRTLGDGEPFPSPGWSPTLTPQK